MARVLKIRDLTLRDGQQSSFATRMNQEQINRCLPYYKEAGFFAMEVWGGAVPDSVMRYLGENPWTRLESIHEVVGDVSKLTALSRGRNLFGYAPYTDEIIDGFCRNAIQSGLGIMRIFDALNDVNNVKSTIKYVKQYAGVDGNHHESCQPHTGESELGVAEVGEGVIDDHRLQDHGRTAEEFHIDPHTTSDDEEREALEGGIVFTVGDGLQNTAHQTDQTANQSTGKGQKNGAVHTAQIAGGISFPQLDDIGAKLDDLFHDR